MLEHEYSTMYDPDSALRTALENDLRQLIQHYKNEWAAFHGPAVTDGESEVACMLVKVFDTTIGFQGYLELMRDRMDETLSILKSGPGGFVYVLKAGRFCKIGRTENLNSRIKTLKIQLPFEAEVLRVIPCEDSRKAEAWLHDRFKASRSNGEWFDLSDYLAMGERFWLLQTTYISRARGACADLFPEMCHSTDYPAALLEDEAWGKAIAEARAAENHKQEGLQ